MALCSWSAPVRDVRSFCVVGLTEFLSDLRVKWARLLPFAGGRDPETEAFVALHLLVGPGLLIFLTVLALYLTGDGLRDALDPMMKNIR